MRDISGGATSDLASGQSGSIRISTNSSMPLVSLRTSTHSSKLPLILLSSCLDRYA